MPEVIALDAERRERAGKGTSRKQRADGRVPAVIYGDKKPPEMITVEHRTLDKLLRQTKFFNSLIDLSVDGEAHRVLARDVQFDPVKDFPIHVDFLRVSAATEITVDVPCRFINHEASPGIKLGGVLNVVRFAVEVVCRAGAIPDEIVVDLTGFGINDSVHISHVKLPENVRPTITGRDFTIATIAAPSGGKSGATEGEG